GREHRRRTRDPELDRRVAEGRVEDQVREEKRIPRAAGEQPVEEDRRLLQVAPGGPETEPGARRIETGGIETRVLEREPAGCERQERDPVDPPTDRGAYPVAHRHRGDLTAEA